MILNYEGLWSIHVTDAYLKPGYTFTQNPNYFVYRNDCLDVVSDARRNSIYNPDEVPYFRWIPRYILRFEIEGSQITNETPDIRRNPRFQTVSDETLDSKRNPSFQM